MKTDKKGKSPLRTDKFQLIIADVSASYKPGENNISGKMGPGGSISIPGKHKYGDGGMDIGRGKGRYSSISVWGNGTNIGSDTAGGGSSYAGRRSVPILKNISLNVRAGEFTALLGPEKSGKTTLLRIAAGLMPPDGGRIMMNDSEVIRNHLKVGYMARENFLLPWKTVAENAALPLLAAGEKKLLADRKIRDWLPVFGLEKLKNEFPAALSPEMQQRTALLRTFMVDSRLMLLDDPLAPLNSYVREKNQLLLVRVWEKFRRSLLFATQSVDEAIFLADYIYVISAAPGRNAFEQRIKLPRPRSREILTSRTFNEYKEMLMVFLKVSGPV